MTVTKWNGSDLPSGLTARTGSSQTRPFVAGLPGDQGGASADDATETAGLLGADTRGDEHHNERERWEASEDFEGLPWWKRPSVCCMVTRSAMLQVPADN